MVVADLILGEAQEQRGLSDGGVAHENELDEKVVAGCCMIFHFT